MMNETSAFALAGDAGIRYSFLKDTLAFGLAVKNFGTKLVYVQEGFPLPLAVHAGAAYRLLNKDISLVFDVQAPYDQMPHFHLGVELARQLGVTIDFALRVGYHTDWAGYANALNGLNAGLGWRWSINRRVLARTGRMIGYKEKKLFSIGLDYAWIPNDQLEPSHRLGLRIGF